ncbi:MAG: Long-chain-fatty-acid--CoA ligase FadD15 [Pseudonocardia sp.]|nr:Long-chain-fatty-acid--CoA ligase FadD15 [Pseudonocardia sp.]
MREYRVPAIAPVAETENLSTAVYDNAERHGDAMAFRRKVGSEWIDVTAREFADHVTRLAAGLIAAGVAPGDRVGVLSRTRYEWTLIDYAIVTAGAITVPIYETSSAEQVAWILTDSGAKAVFVELPGHHEIVDGVAEQVPDLQQVWEIEAGAVDALIEQGADVPADEVHKRRHAVRSSDLSTVIYTSGTTGRPKGCELTHHNLVALTKAASSVFSNLLNPDGSVLLFLPLAHVFAKDIECGGVYTCTTIGHTPDIKELLPDLAEFKPTFVLAVPRVFEKVYNGALQKAHGDGKGKIFDAAAATAVEWSRALDTGGPGLAVKLKHAVFDRLVYSRLRAVLGGRCLGAVSGGAPLGERLGHFFRGIGVPVYEGYGLTETSGGITANGVKAFRVGTVGRPMPGNAVRIADDNEVLLSGDNVFRGYWRNPEATAEAMTDGWFHTGDLGELDDAGFLRITGRKKEIIVTAGGKNVAPAVLEDRLRAHPLISQTMVVGDGQPFIGALITIDPEALPAWRAAHGKRQGEDAADLVDDEDLLAEIERAVQDANKAVSHAEAIKKFRILPADLTVEGGELSAKQSVKRHVVAKVYADDIAAIYAR